MHTREGEKGKELISMRTFNKQRLKRKKGQQLAGDKPLPETGMLPVSNSQSQMTLQNWKTVSKTSQHTDSRGPANRSLTCPKKEGAKQRNKPSVNQHSENPTPKQDSW
jgi:hypothetical protein